MIHKSPALLLSKLWHSAIRPSLWPMLIRGVAPAIEHHRLLGKLDFDFLIDVGANRGQFSMLAKMLHPHVRISAYEPLESEADYFRIFASRWSDVALHVLALGERFGTEKIHLSRRPDSSSLLPIGNTQQGLFPNTDEVGQRSVHVARLDDLPSHWQHGRRILLKIDVQGFELSVLRGAQKALAHFKYVLVECSSVTLYEGQALFPEVLTFLEGAGYAVTARTNEQWSEGTLVQADYLFTRNTDPV